MRRALILLTGLGLVAQSPFAVKTTTPAGAQKAPALVKISGKVTQWVGGSVGHSPKEKPLNQATVVIGQDLQFQSGNSGMDTIRGQVAAKILTDANGRWEAKVPAGTHTVTYWKAGYTPSINNPLQAPGDHTGTISQDKQMQGLHRTLHVAK